MKNLKKLALLLGLSLALVTAGCGTSKETVSSDTTISQNVSSTDETQAGNSKTQTDSKSDSTDASSDEATNETTKDVTDHDDTDLSKKGVVQDASAALRQSAKKGSLDTIYGKYQVQDGKGVYYYFGEDGVSYYVQSGTYTYEHDTNVDGEEADLLLMTFDTLGTPTQYTIKTEDGQVYLTTTESGAQSTTTIDLAFVKGKDAVTKMKPFEGIYTLYGQDNYRYEFHEDGNFYLIVEQSYGLKDQTLTLSAFDKDVTYDYKVVDDNIELSSEDTTVAVLEPTK